jgi:hypothetical protein
MTNGMSFMVKNDFVCLAISFFLMGIVFYVHQSF